MCAKQHCKLGASFGRYRLKPDIPRLWPRSTLPIPPRLSSMPTLQPSAAYQNVTRTGPPRPSRLFSRNDHRNHQTALHFWFAAGFFADGGAGDALRNADIGLFLGGGIVDAIAGHRDDVMARLQCLHNP